MCNLLLCAIYYYQNLRHWQPFNVPIFIRQTNSDCYYFYLLLRKNYKIWLIWTSYTRTVLYQISSKYSLIKPHRLLINHHHVNFTFLHKYKLQSTRYYLFLHDYHIMRLFQQPIDVLLFHLLKFDNGNLSTILKAKLYIQTFQAIFQSSCLPCQHSHQFLNNIHLTLKCEFLEYVASNKAVVSDL